MLRVLVAIPLLMALGALAATPVGVTLEDLSRARPVPVEIYQPAPAACAAKCQVVLFGTGYRATPSEYSFLLSALAEAGFFVVGVQHDLKQDTPMPSTGDVMRDRSPFWDRGMANIGFVKDELSRRFPENDWSQVVLAGHSQGGDVAARLAAKPGFPVRSLLTLDNRRAPLPAAGNLDVLTIRSSDQPADPGVIPDLTAGGRGKVCIVRMPTTRHDDMNDAADPPAKSRMTEAVLGFLLQGRCAGDA